ncbi:ABC transporter permease [Streptomyces sp. XM4193]|uniref:FtsX-like permease family protein n=1 Tax=Streptomyces sp. XM4193 TaxID=2929782 RepID=UPI001FFC29BC|nr:ABC transporter permease [Streptomyces sp. XM4193]MCK1798943.1 ABC transporter permease [Streptomyces sp. XM4193]
MLTVAFHSLRHRPGRLAATLLSSVLGAMIIMMFNSLHDTAAGAEVDEVSSNTLTTAAAVVGGYGTLLVFFAIASTLTVNVRQRGEEIALLRSTGATPAQISRMVVGEAALVATVAVVIAVAPAVLGGRLLLEMFRDSGQVAEQVPYAFGPVAMSSGAAVTLLAAVGAACLSVRRARNLAAGRVRRGGRARRFAGLAALVAGTAGVGATFAMDATEPALMAAPAYGAILLSVGLAVFAPAATGALLRLLTRPLSALPGGCGYLVVRDMRSRAAELAGVTVPLTLFTGISVATLHMQSIENGAIAATGLTRSVDDKNMETLNLVVVGIIAVFACVLLINTLYAATTYRAAQFGQQRLAGATSRQVLAAVALESGVLTVIGLLCGTLAAFAGIVPFSLVRTDAVMPGQGPGIWLAVAATASLATFATSLLTARRALRTPAVEAVGLAA